MRNIYNMIDNFPQNKKAQRGGSRGATN
jgi:hypothetical protein